MDYHKTARIYCLSNKKTVRSFFQIFTKGPSHNPGTKILKNMPFLHFYVQAILDLPKDLKIDLNGKYRQIRSILTS